MAKLRTWMYEALCALLTGAILGTLLLVTTYLVVVPPARPANVPSGTPAPELTIVALGDSYMSGEGAEAFLVGTDGPVNKCRQAATAYPVLIAQDLNAKLIFVPCSGATVENIASVHHEEILTPTPHPFSDGRPQIAALREHPDANLVLVSVGGNDAQFAEIISMCMGPRHQCSDIGGHWLAELRRVIQPRMAALFREIRTIAPHARILVMTYPAPLGASQSQCEEVGLSESEAGFLADFARILKLHIDQAAIQAGAEPVDLSTAFEGHGLCSNSPTPALNGWHFQKAAGPSLDPLDLVRGSFHPTPYGHELIRQRIHEHLTAFSPPPGELPPPPPSVPNTGISESGNVWQQYGLTPNPCTPGVHGRSSSTHDGQLVELRDVRPLSKACYRLVGDPWSTVDVPLTGATDLIFPRVPVRGESGTREVVYQRSDGTWWLWQLTTSSDAQPVPALTLIDSWFGGRPQLFFFLGALIAGFTALGGALRWMFRRRRPRRAQRLVTQR